MSADLLRRAAQGIRMEEEYAYTVALADWLDHLAEMEPDWAPYVGCGWCSREVDHALTVARAYLGELGP